MRAIVTCMVAILRSGTLAACASVLAVASAQAHDSAAEERALRSLVDAELAFSAMAQQRGVRAAFLANFAADGIVFEPSPVRLQDAWRARPEPTDPLALRLEWKPAQAGVARSLDMGFTTGPFTLRQAAHPDVVRHGVFFSVWQRDAAGAWHVSVDAGIGTGQAVDFVALGAAPRPHFAEGRGTASQRERLLDLERQPLATGKAGAGEVRYASLLADDARLHRDGAAPIAGRDAAAAAMARRASRIAWTPFEARMARSADLAVTYGRYRESADQGDAREGYYTHLWLRDRRGRWRLAYDIATAPS